MKTKKIHFRSSSRAVALEPRLLFDGAGAVATADAITDFDYSNEAQDDGLVQDVHENSVTRTSAAEGGAIEIIEGDDSLHIPSSLGSRLGLDAEQENILAGTEEKTLLIIDSRVDNHELLLESVGASVTVVVVGEGESGLDAISNALAGSNGYDAIHIISHGTPGSFTLGSDQVDSATLNQNSEQLQAWADHLNPGADILLYGCDVAQGEAGQSFIDQLAAITGADIAASTNPTGNAEHGGDWVLERNTGPIEAGVLAVAVFEGLLADTAINDSETADRITAEDTPLAIEGITISDADNPASMTVQVQTDGGTSSVTLSGNATISSGSSGSEDFTISGSLADINNTLASLKYSPTENQNSLVSGFAPKITLTATDVTNNGNTATKVVNLSVTAVNDNPYLDGGVALAVDESGSASFSLAQLAPDANTLDPDIATGQQVVDQLVVIIDALPAHGKLTYQGGVVAVKQVIPVTDLGNLKYQHTGGDLTSVQTDTVKITVKDGGGGETTKDITINISPKNVAPSISGSPSLIEGQHKNIGQQIAIDWGDQYDTNNPDLNTIEISNVVTGSQGDFYFTQSGSEVKIAGTTTLTETEFKTLVFKHNGAEPNGPGAIKPSFDLKATDAGGGEGDSAKLDTSKTITLDVTPNNDDPTLTNTHSTVDNALTVDERTSSVQPTIINNIMLKVSDNDRDPNNLAQTTPADQLVYTIGTAPTQGELQLYIGGNVGYAGDGWITLGADGRFTQADIDAGHVRYYQTTDISADTADSFTFTVRDSAFGYDLSDPSAENPAIREGAVRDSNGKIETQTFHLWIKATDTAHGDWTGGPREPTPGYGTPTDGGNLSYVFDAVVSNPGNETRATWNEATGGDYTITKSMLEYAITREYTKDSVTTIITVPASETVYTLTAPPPNGTLQRLVGGSWVEVGMNDQFTQADINGDKIRFVHDGSENHTATFGYKVSDGTPKSYDGSFAIDITPTNDRPTASGGTTQVAEGDNNTVRLGSDVLGMADVDQSEDINKRTGEGAKDFLWFKINTLPTEGTLQRWNGTQWVDVTNSEWLPQTLLTASADGATSGLRYVHNGSEPLAYTGGPKVTFNYVVRDDLAEPTGSNPEFQTNSAADPGNTSGEDANLSASATSTINIIPINNPPLIADNPNASDPVIDATITDGGALTGANQTLTNVPEGSTAIITSAHLTAIDSDNTTTQRQYRLTSLPTEGTLLLNGKTLGIGSTFTQADIDGNKLKYKHGGKEVGNLIDGNYHDKFNFVVSDGAATTGSKEFWITLTPMNDKPTVSVPSGPIDVFVSGSTTVSVSGISVDDPDLAQITVGVEENFLRVEVEVLDNDNNPVTDAKLNYTGTDPVNDRAYIHGKDSNKLIIQGTKAQVNAALNTLTVAFTSDMNRDNLKIKVTVDDQLYKADGSKDTGANGGGATNADGSAINDNNNRVSKEFTVRASSTNDVPTITNTSSYSVNEDASITLNGFTLSDADSFDKNVTVKVELFNNSDRNTLADKNTEGKLTYSGLSNVTASGTGTNTVTLTGKLSDVEAALNQIQFQGATDYNGIGSGNGTLYLRTTFTDFGHADQPDGNSVSIDKDITIVPVNDKPVLTVPGNQTMAEGTYIDIASGFLVQDDKDINQGATDYIEVTLNAKEGTTDYGTLSIEHSNLSSINVTVENNGSSTIVVKGKNADVTTALNTLRYTPTKANVDKVVSIKVTADDKENGKEGSGIGGNSTVDKTFTITISGTNDAPVVTVPSPINVAEDSSGTTISGVSYTDSDDFGGIQRITVEVTHGTLDFGTKTGLTLVEGTTYNSAIITVEGTKANLNAALATLKYTPTGDYHGSDTLTVTADDKGLVGTGGVKTDTKTVAITVTPVNDRPVATTDVTLTAINEDSTPNGTAFNSLNFGYSDATDDQTAITDGGNTATDFTYIAITGNAATATQGVWQVLSDGNSWIDIPTSGLSNTSALIFDFTHQVRFKPAEDFNGTPGKLTVRLADGSKTDIPVSANNTDTKNLTDAANGSINNQTGSWNDADRTIGISVTAVNDAPTKIGADPSFSVTEDASNPAGKTISDLFGANFSDAKDQITDGSSADNLAGVAITGVTIDKGVWEYSTDGGSSWTAVPTDVTDSNAFVLATTDQLRFRPTAQDYNGTPTDSLTVRLIDDSSSAVTSATRLDLSGSNSGGTTPYSDSSNAVTLGAVVTSVNDAPTFTAGGETTDITVTVTESNTVTGTGNAFEVALLTNVAVGDVDLGLGGLDSNIFGAGSITVTLTDKIAGDILTVDSNLTGISSVTNYDPDTGELVINLTNTATVAQVKTILEAVKYAHRSDDPTNIKSGSEKTTRDFTVVLSDGNNDQGSGKHAGGPAPLSVTVSGTITITPDNDPPVAVDDGNLILNSDTEAISGDVIKGEHKNTGGNTASGTGVTSGPDSDPDNPNTDLTITAIEKNGDTSSSKLVSGETEITGAHGTLTIKADGTYTYKVNQDDPAVYGLAENATITDTFTYTLSDGDKTATADLVITIQGNEPAAPSITVTPNTDVGSTGADALVSEKGLTNGSTAGTGHTTSGEFEVSMPSGLVSLDIETKSFSLNELQGASESNPLEVPHGSGILKITGYGKLAGDDSAPQKVKLTYTYELTKHVENPADTADDKGTTETFNLTATGQAGSPATGNLKVYIVDDVPSANPDTNSITEDATSAATGNVLTGTGGDQADVQGADGATVTQIIKGTGTPNVAVAAGSSSTSNGTEVTGDYGTLTIGADGSYSYTLDNTNLTVQGLNSGETLTETYSYTITDTDGDTSTTTLTITIHGADDGVTVNVPNNTGATTPDNNKTDQVVFESGLDNGSNPSADDIVVESSFTIVALDGLDTTDAVSIGYKDVAGDDQTLTLTKAVLEALSGTPQTITTQYGTLELNGYTQASDGTITVDYNYTLTTAPQVSGEDTSDSFTITAKDRDSQSSTQTLNIKIVDDAPTAVADTNSITEDATDPATGNVLTGTGGGDAKDTQGADGATVTGLATGTQSKPVTGNLGGSGLAGSYGTLTLNTDGSYSYTLDNTNLAVQGLNSGETLTETYSYIITDADGDTSTTTLTITIHGADDGVTVDVPNNTDATTPDNNKTDQVVFESGLANGSNPSADDIVVESSFTIVALDGLDATDAVSIDYKDAAGADQTLTLTKAELEALSGTSQAITTQYGTLELNGYTQASDGTITVDYTYTLTTAPEVSGEDTSDSFIITAKDRDSQSSTQTLNIKIVDDAPTANDDAATADNATNTVVGNALTAGSNQDVADVKGADGATITDISSDNVTANNSTDAGGKLTIMGEHGTLVIDKTTGEYTYTRTSDVELQATDVFTYTLTDGDGDSDTATITITINDLAPTDPVDGNGNPPTTVPVDPADPTAGNRLVLKPDDSVSESGLPNGSTEGNGSNKTTGSITYTPGDGDHTATIKDKDGVEQPVTEGAVIETPHGKVTITTVENGKIVYEYELTEPTTGDNTTDEFDVTIKDVDGDSTKVTVAIDIVDDAPTANNDAATVDNATNTVVGNALTAGSNQDVADVKGADGATITDISSNNVTANNSTDAGGKLTIIGEHGTLVIDKTTGEYTYTRTSGEELQATDVFTYTLTDGDGDSDTATITITINDLAPTDPVDGNGNPPTTVPVDPADPTAGNKLVLKPDDSVNESGLPSGSTEGDGSNKITGSITYTPGDGEHTATIKDKDGVEQPVTEGAVIETPHGKVTITTVENGKIVYEYELTEPTTGDDTTDEFDVTITDEDGDSTTVTVVVDIVDDEPTAQDDSGEVKAKETLTVPVDKGVLSNDTSGADGWKHEGAVVGVVSSNKPGNSVDSEGWLEGEFGRLKLNPDGSYAYEAYEAKPGSAPTTTDRFVYTVSDADGDQATAELVITIENNQPPVIVENPTVTTPEDTGVNGNLVDSASDPDDEDTLTVTEIVVGGDTPVTVPGDGTPVEIDIPGKGTLIVDKTGDYTFTPTPDWHGDVPEITFTIDDGKGADNSTVEGKLNITVTPVQDAFDDTGSTHVNTPITTPVLDNDLFNDPDAKITATTPPANGTIVVNDDGTITYTPEFGFTGTDTYTYTVTSGGVTETATVTIEVTNQPPAPVDDAVSTPEDTPVDGNLLANDGDEPDGDPLTVTEITIGGVATQVPTDGSSVTVVIPDVGSVTVDKDGNYSFTPLPDWNGEVPSIAYTVDDGTGSSNSSSTAELSITVTPVQDAFDDTGSTHVNTPVTTPVLGNDRFSDPDATITATTPPANGTIVVNDDGTITYTPEFGFTGTDTYTYTVTSGGVTETATVTIEVTNQPPAPVDDAVSTPEDTPVNGNLLTNDGDEPDGDPLTVTEITTGGVTTQVPTDGSSVTVVIPDVGSVTVDKDGNYSFTPVPDWNGTVPPITYTVDDGTGSSNSSSTATLNITVTPVQDIENDQISTPAGNPVDVPVLGNDGFSDPGATITGTTPPANGKVTINPGGTITYTPNPGFSGEDSFTYTVTTEGGITETGTVTVVVHPEHIPTPVPPASPDQGYQPPGGIGTDKARDSVTGSPVITDPSVFFEGERWDDVRRLPIPLHPVLYVNNQVADSQLEREQADLHIGSSPDLATPYQTQAASIGGGLGQDQNLFVSHAIRAAQGTASELEARVASRLARINLSADDLLPAAELRQADPAHMVPDLAAVTSDQPRWISQQTDSIEEAEAVDEPDAGLVAQNVSVGAAPSFTEQLRSGDKRLSMAALNKTFLTN